MLGSWDPCSAIPMNWSDGDLWTLDLVSLQFFCYAYGVLRHSSGFLPTLLTSSMFFNRTYPLEDKSGSSLY